MRKIFSLLMVALFSVTMALADVGELYYTFTIQKPSSGAVSDYTKSGEQTIDELKWDIPGNWYANGALRLGGKNIDGVDRVITGKSTMGDAIAKIVIAHAGTTSDNIVLNSITVTVASDNAFSEDVESVTLTSGKDFTVAKNTNGTIEIKPTNDSWAKDSYYKFAFNFTNKNSSNYAWVLNKIEFYSFKDLSGCANLVAITKGDEVNGTFALSATEVCGDGEGEDVSVTDIVPAEGYVFGEITTSASGVVDNENKKVTGITAATTISVVFNEIPKYTVSFSTGEGNPAQDPIAELVGGAGIELPAGPAPKCEDWAFAGWAEAAVAVETTEAPELLAAGANYKPAENVTLHAVYKRVEEGGVADLDVTETFEKQATSTTYNDTIEYEAANSIAELAWTMYYGTVSTNDKISGNNSAHMRWYASADDKLGCIVTNTPVPGLKSIDFKARVSNTAVKMSVWYSTDGENWTIVDENLTFSKANSGLDFSSEIKGTEGVGYYVKIGVGDGGTAPSSGNYKLIIDDIKFNYRGAGKITYYLSAPSCAAPEPEKEVIYFVNVPGWENLRVHLWGGTATGTEWPGVEMTKLGEEEKINDFDVYKYEADKGAYVNCIFSDNGANQTANLDWTAGQYFYDGAWYAKENIPAPVVPAKFYITGNAALVGEEKAWNEKAIKSEANEYVIEGLKAGEEYQLKVIEDGNWMGGKVYGYSNLTEKPEGLSADKDDNIVFKLAEDGDVKVIYYWEEVATDDWKMIFKLEGNFYVKPLVLKDIKLVPNQWADGDAKIAAWVWDKEGEMTNYFTDFFAPIAEDNDTLVAKINAEADSIIFVRFAPAQEAPAAWEGPNQWNQTPNDSIQWEKGIFTILPGGDYWSNGTWDAYVPEVPAKFYITGDSALVVDAGLTVDKKWAPNAIKSEAVSYKLNLKAGVDYMLKITVDGTWDTGKGYDELYEYSTKDGLYRGEGADNNNICFRLNADGEVNVHYDGEYFFLSGDFYVAPEPEKQYFLKNNWAGGDWKWVELVKNTETGYYESAILVFGGEGVNFNTAESDEGATWIAAEDIDAMDMSTYDMTTLAAFDTVAFVFDPEAVNAFTGANGLSAYVIGKYVAPEPVLPVVGLGASFNGWAWNENLLTPAEDKLSASIKVNLEAGQYELKMVVDGKWMTVKGEDETQYQIHRDWNYAENINLANIDGFNMVLTADVEGEYTFTWTYESKNLVVTFPDKGTGTALDNTAVDSKAVKVLRNGQLLIIKGEKVYNVIGGLVK